MIKKRIKLNDLGSDQPVFSLLGAEDLLPLAGEQGKAFKQIKQDANSRATFLENIEFIEDFITEKTGKHIKIPLSRKSRLQKS